MLARTILITTALIIVSSAAYVQQPAQVREYKKVFRTYPFSDPDPVPEMTKIYPYYRFDGYTDEPVNREWKVVELENDFIKVMVLPEIGGKIWAAFEKGTGKSFIYYNQVVKFRDVAMRGPWTSGGLEPNYGIVGHTPNCATPVDYTLIKKPDGSVSCVVGVLDLLTRSVWRLDINLQKDKAYFTTSSTWYNASPFEQPYYHWMNGALKAADDLQFVFPGTKYIGHAGEHSKWPVDDKGRDLSYYRNNNFGSYKSYHVFGKHTNFWGGYYHDEQFGMGRYSGYDDKAGKKIWIWGLSREGMIWEKLLTDNDGQYVEVQSGRLFNQPAEESSFTPFKNRGFTPHTTDKWTEYWFPVKNTGGFVAASDFGALNLKKEGQRMVIVFSPVQPVQDELSITQAGKVIYKKNLNLKTLELFRDSFEISGDEKNIQVRLGENKLFYDAREEAGNLSRPFESPKGFDWNSAHGLHLQGKELIRQRMYTPAEAKLNASLKADSNYLPALADMALLMYRQMKYDKALAAAMHALSIDAYDPAANYYYGLINERLGRNVDAKDGFDIASQSVEYRSAAFTRLATIYHKEAANDKAVHYAQKAIEANSSAVDAYQLLALIQREEGNREEADRLLEKLATIDPLNHFVNFERYVWHNNAERKNHFISNIRNEMPEQTFLELAIWYYNAGAAVDARKVLELSKPNAEVECWQAYLQNRDVDTVALQPSLVFPFRHETAEVLEKLVNRNDHWLPKYYLALIRWNSNDLARAKNLMEQCGEKPGYAPFYAVRSNMYMSSDSLKALADLQKAKNLDKNQWRYGKSLINYYLSTKQAAEASKLAAAEFKKYPSNYVLGMLYAKALIQQEDYAAADKLLMKLNVLPNEGATGGRLLYRETKLMLAVQNMRAGNYSKALPYLQAAKEWPERLGSGKPYDEDIDERLEDWLSYQSYTRTGNEKAAKQALEKIVTYTRSVEPSRRPSLYNLISAKALKLSGRQEEAKAFLKNIADKNPSSEVAKWTFSEFSGEAAAVPEQVSTNEVYRMLVEAKAL